MIPALDEHQLLVFWAQLFIVVLCARALGQAMRQVGLPSIVGQLGAGVLLGPTVLGRVWAPGFDWLFPADELQGGLLVAVGWVGIALLLVVTGFETDLTLITKLGRASAIVSAASIVVPLVSGLILGLYLPDRFLGPDATRLSFTLFIGSAIAVSSLAVVARILSELGFMRRDFGQVTVAAGMANDVVGWLLLGAIAALGGSGRVSVGDLTLTLGGLALLVALSLTIGQRMIDGVLKVARREGENVAGGVAAVLIIALAYAVITQAIGVEGVLGAFVAGVLLGRSRFQQSAVLGHIEVITSAFLAPVFFATAGLRVDIGLLIDEGVVGWAALLVVVAIVAKFAGAYLGARWARMSPREGAALGAGLNARGALEIVIATVGLSLGVLNDTAYTAVVLVPIVTSLFAAVGLRAAVRGWAGSEAEQDRLRREEELAANVVVRNERILLPTRAGIDSLTAAQLLHYAWPEQAEVTVARVLRDGESTDMVDIGPVLDVFHDREHAVIDVGWTSAGDELVAEARLGFGVIGLGVPDIEKVKRENGHEATPALIGDLATRLLEEVTIPLLIVRRARNKQGRMGGAFFSRAVVPVTGTRSSRAAQEVAYSISSDLGTEVVLTHVVDRSGAPVASFPRLLTRARGAPREDEVGHRLLREASARAVRTGVRARSIVRYNHSVADELVAMVQETEADLLVLGGSARRAEGSAFLGHTVEQVLERCDATVAVVISPAEAS